VLGVGAALSVAVSERTRLGTLPLVSPSAAGAVVAARVPDPGRLFQKMPRINVPSSARTLQVCLPVNTL
jgi:hypothetical protein